MGYVINVAVVRAVAQNREIFFAENGIIIRTFKAAKVILIEW
jgi:hypothetical protein